jgi:hypothetical protein
MKFVAQILGMPTEMPQSPYPTKHQADFLDIDQGSFPEGCRVYPDSEEPQVEMLLTSQFGETLS